jgi:hypothetical protein
MPPPDKCMEIGLRVVGVVKDKMRERKEHKEELERQLKENPQEKDEEEMASKEASNKNSGRKYLIPIFVLLALVAVLGTTLGLAATHPGLVGKPCPTPAIATQKAIYNNTSTISQSATLNTTMTITQTETLNITMTTTQVATLSTTMIITQTATSSITITTTHSVNPTSSGDQATATPMRIDAVAIADCLSVLEAACASKTERVTFGECDPLFSMFYCDLTDMMIVRGAMKPGRDGFSPVCEPMKKFCWRSTPPDMLPLAGVSP